MKESGHRASEGDSRAPPPAASPDWLHSPDARRQGGFCSSIRSLSGSRQRNAAAIRVTSRIPVEAGFQRAPQRPARSEPLEVNRYFPWMGNFK